MRLSLFINPTGHHQAAWRHPRADADAGINFDHYKQLAIAAERAKFDAVFLADNQAVRVGAPEAVSRVAQFVANFEPLTMIAALAALTERIGFISTASTSYNYPYQIARKFASLDFISGGRIGWNIVTSGMAQEAYNFGRDEHYADNVRYVRAAEFVEVCLGLWDSWEDDAFPRDKATGVFSDLSKMHVLDHAGEHFRVLGPLNVPRSPQARPLLVQAGASDTGVDFAARYADMVFVTPQSLEQARKTYTTLKEAAAGHGRNPDDLKVMPGLVAIAGPTTREAEETFEQLQELLHPDVTLNTLSLKLQGDITKYPLDEPLPESAVDSVNPVYFAQWMDIARRENLTLRQLALRASGSMAGLGVRGTGAEIADLMEEWYAGGAADGFNVQPAFLPGAFHDFVEFVVPELRRRGLVRSEYEGRTLREHFGLERPEWGKSSIATASGR
jgi:FMN-dependent oxidoreductase (nitrilotriacetate monooxygenase family)